MMKTARFPLFLLLGALLTLVACRQTSPITRTDRDGEVWVQGHFKSGLEVDGIFNANGSLDHSPFLGEYFPGTGVKLIDLRSAESASGFARVQATVQNPSRTRERIQYRYLWYDAAGMEIGTGTSGWVSETLESKESRSLEGVARAPEATRFKLFIRTYNPKK